MPVLDDRANRLDRCYRKYKGERPASPVSVRACAARPNSPDAVLNTIEFRLTPSSPVRCPHILPTSPYPTPAHSSIQQADIGTPAARVDWAFAGRPDKTASTGRAPGKTIWSFGYSLPKLPPALAPASCPAPAVQGFHASPKAMHRADKRACKRALRRPHRASG